MIRDDIKAATIAAMKGGDKDDDRHAPPRPGGDQEPRHRGAHRRRAQGRRRAGHRSAAEDGQAAPRIGRHLPQDGREDRAAVEEAEIAVIERFLPAADERRRSRGRDPRDRRRNRRVVDEGHGPGDGAGEGAARRRRSSRRARSGLVKAALVLSDMKKAPPRERRSLNRDRSNDYLAAAAGLPPAAPPVRPVTPSIDQLIEKDGDRGRERAGHADLQIGRTPR